MEDFIVKIIIAIVVSAVFGWLFGFITFLYRYKRNERCYLCDKIIEVKELLACEECNQYARTLADGNLARELCKTTKRLTEVNVYMLKGQIGAWRGKEKYQEVNETIVCSDNFIEMFNDIVKFHGDNSIEVKLQDAGVGKTREESYTRVQKRKHGDTNKDSLMKYAGIE